MKKNIFRIVLVLLIAGFIDACQKDSTTDPSVTGTDRDKFLGTWITQSSGTSGTLNFTMTIAAGASSANQVKIANFDLEGSGAYIFADVSGNSLTISLPPLNVIGNDTIEGTGTYNSNNTLSFNYTIRNGQTVDVRTATAHK